MANQIEYRELFDLNAALLSKHDFFELEKILLENSNTDKIKFDLSFDSTTISAESAEELLSHADLPLSTDQLSIGMTRWIDTEEYKGISGGISLSLHYNHINCQIHSIDQTWFLGKKAQIEKFFKLKKPWYFFLNKSFPAFPTIVMLMIAYSSALLVKKQYFEMIVPIVCSVVLLIVTVLTFKEKLFPYVRIYLKEKVSIKFGFNEWCALIGAISSFAAIVQMVSKLYE